MDALLESMSLYGVNDEYAASQAYIADSLAAAEKVWGCELSLMVHVTMRMLKIGPRNTGRLNPSCPTRRQRRAI